MRPDNDAEGATESLNPLRVALFHCKGRSAVGLLAFVTPSIHQVSTGSAVTLATGMGWTAGAG